MHLFIYYLQLFLFLFLINDINIVYSYKSQRYPSYLPKKGTLSKNIIQKNDYKKNIIQPSSSLNKQIPSRNDYYFKNKFIIQNRNQKKYSYKNKELFLEDNPNYQNKTIISISPGGLQGFYMLGISTYIKENYDLSTFLFSGASAGAWNALFMTFRGNMEEFKEILFHIDYEHLDSIYQIQTTLKNEILKKYSSIDFDLDRLFIGVSTFENFQFNNVIYSNFQSLHDALDACIASSNIPFITGELIYLYQNKLSFDGGLHKYPYLDTNPNSLHISHDMWKKIPDNKILPLLPPFYQENREKSEELITFNPNYFFELYSQGYYDAQIHQTILNQYLMAEI